MNKFLRMHPKNKPLPRHNRVASGIRQPPLPYLLVSLLFSLLTAGYAQAAAKPNIVLILADDLDATTSEYWERADAAGKDDPLKQTRALLKDKGVTFTNAFAPTPICCPARATILTGKYGHNTGVLTNAGTLGGLGAFNGRGNDMKTFAVWLKNAGYTTGLVGKYLNGIADVPGYVAPGWTEFNAFYDKGLQSYVGYDYDMGVYNEDNDLAGTRTATIRHFGSAESDYSTDVVKQQAVDFINRRSSGEKPFFLYVAATAPHLPLPPAPRHQPNPYSGLLTPVPKRPNFNEPDVSDKSLWLTESAPARSALVDTWNPNDYRNRQGSLYALDELVASVVTTLEAKGVLNNTYIIFMSDNGYNLGAHRLIHKMAPYEESIRVPLVIRGPSIAAGSKRNSMVLETDLAPTFATWAGLPVPADVDGRSLTEVLASTTTPTNWRKDFLMQYAGDSAGKELGIAQEIPGGNWAINFTMDLPTYRALRNERYTYVEFTQGLVGGTLTEVKQYELYDNVSDPYQLNNLLSTLTGKIKYADKKKELSDRMDTLTVCGGVDCRN